LGKLILGDFFLDIYFHMVQFPFQHSVTYVFPLLRFWFFSITFIYFLDAVGTPSGLPSVPLQLSDAGHGLPEQSGGPRRLTYAWWVRRVGARIAVRDEPRWGLDRHRRVPVRQFL